MKLWTRMIIDEARDILRSNISINIPFKWIPNNNHKECVDAYHSLPDFPTIPFGIWRAACRLDAAEDSVFKHAETEEGT